MTEANQPRSEEPDARYTVENGQYCCGVRNANVAKGDEITVEYYDDEGTHTVTGEIVVIYAEDRIGIQTEERRHSSPDVIVTDEAVREHKGDELGVFLNVLYGSLEADNQDDEDDDRDDAEYVEMTAEIIKNFEVGDTFHVNRDERTFTVTGRESEHMCTVVDGDCRKGWVAITRAGEPRVYTGDNHSRFSKIKIEGNYDLSEHPMNNPPTCATNGCCRTAHDTAEVGDSELPLCERHLS